MIVIRKGNLYYWQHRVLVEFIGIREDGKYMFNTTNSGILCLNEKQVQSQITEDKL